ncbi:MAG: flavoprotein [Deltaproteobacteria bacterium]|nr:MAG: flavoprotein [Deltaproteobacteria bacterium]
MLDWLIIGGGIHGVHVAASLRGRAGVDGRRLRIVDPGAQLLDRWRACTGVTGMTHLRSPAVHHLALEPMSLHQYAGQRRHRAPGVFAPPYDRPSLALFNAHCDAVIEEHGLAAGHVRARATSVDRVPDGWTVHLDGGAKLDTRQLVLAMGSAEAPAMPAWSLAAGEAVRHVFDPALMWPSSAPPLRIAVVGGGITACQVALRLAGEGHAVHLLCRHALREHQFDSDPGWLGPKYMAAFERERDWGARRRMIARARHRGSVPPDVHAAIRRAREGGRLRIHESGVVGCVTTLAGEVRLRTDEGEFPTGLDRVLLATGFATERPGGDLVDRLVEEERLAVAPCGYPVVDGSLQWASGLFVTGPLAELELGPSSRNIAGARRAGERLVARVRSAGVSEGRWAS